MYFLNSGWRDKGLEHFLEVCSETLACTTDKTKLLLNPSAKQRWNPCCRPPPEYQDLSMCHDWSFLKSHCQFANQANGETFCFPEKRLLSILNFVPRVTCCWLADNQLSWNVLLFSCNRIGQLCVSGPVYSSHTVRSELRLSCPTLGSSPSKICQMESSLHTQMSEDWRDTRSRACRWGGWKLW